MTSVAPPVPALHAAYAALQAGDFVRAESIAREQLALDSRSEPALWVLAVSLEMQDRIAEAADAYTELTRRSPATNEHWNNLGNILRKAARPAEAEQAFQRGLELAPNDVGLRVNLAILCMESNAGPRARRLFLEAVELAPSLPDPRIYAARLCYDNGDASAAMELLEDWRRWPQLAPEVQLELGWMLTLIGEDRDGERMLRETLHRVSDKTRVRTRLIQLYERLNRLDEARRLLAELPNEHSVASPVLRDEIRSAKAAMILRESDPEKARIELEALIAGLDADASTSHGALYYPLAKILDRQRDSDGAMAALAKAHAARLAQVYRADPEWKEPGVKPLYTATVLVTPEQFAAWTRYDAPTAEESPIFVVGFPRSGTTMLEQMLDAHPSLRSMDERSYIQGLVDRLPVSYPDQLGQLSAEQCRELRDQYWEMVTHVVRLAPGERLVDKNPLNILRLPMIQRVFPNARIILALRHPCDVVLSCYMQDFRAPSFGVLCATLDKLVEGYVDSMNSWIHHAALMKPDAMELRYEDLLADFEGYVEKIGRFLGLDDATPMLAFHEHAQRKGYISTPSYHQVVEPPNTKAVGRWRRYEKYFEPVLPALKPIMEHWRYE